MFENLFLPYLFNNFKENSSELDNLNDPIDNCMSIKFNETKKVYLTFFLLTYTFEYSFNKIIET